MFGFLNLLTPDDRAELVGNILLLIVIAIPTAVVNAGRIRRPHHPHMADPRERHFRHPHHRRPGGHPIGKRHVGTSDINGRHP